VEVWEQHEGEPDEAYVRFLYYRNLGPTRSLNAAYQLYVESGEIETKEKAVVVAPKRAKSCRASGQWKEDSSNYQWEFRANQWDIHIMSQSSRVVVDSFFKGLAVLATQNLNLLQSGLYRPKNYLQLLEGLTLVGSFITPEVIATWAAITNGDGPQREVPTPAPGNVSSINDSKRRAV
jgi:hypothetical protein